MLIFLSLILLVLAYPPFNLGILILFAFIPLFISLFYAKDFKSTLGQALFFAFAFHLYSSWPILVLNKYVGFWPTLAWIGFSLYGALFFLLPSGAVYFLKDKPAGNFRKISFILGLSSAWVMMEYFQSFGLLATTQDSLAYFLSDYPVLLQSASFWGMYGISFLIILANVLLALFMVEKNKGRWVWLGIFLLIWGGNAFWGAGQMAQKLPQAQASYNLALIQGNIPQEKKLDYNLMIPNVEKHKLLTRQAKEKNKGIDLVIWPETAINAYLNRTPAVREYIFDFLQKEQIVLLTGASYYESNRAYNSIYLINSQRQVLGRYDKENLVAFGEYLPFRSLLLGLFKDSGFFAMDYSSNPVPVVLRYKDLSIAPLICFESLFPDLVRKRVLMGANFILTLTNDAWFVYPFAAQQHARAGVLRAIENRKFFAQAANTGISFVADPYGRVLIKSILNQESILMQKVYPLSGQTFYSKWGNFVVGLSFMFLLLAFFLRRFFT